MDIEAIRNYPFGDIVHDYDWKDTALYALSLGYGADPLDGDELSFVYEKAMRAVPSFCNVLAHPPFWLRRPELKVDWVQLLHAEQGFTLHRPLPVEGRLRATFHMVSVEDKGAAKGAIVSYEKRLSNDTGELLYATVTTSVFLRGDGGQGGFGVPAAPMSPLPQRQPDDVIDVATLPGAALLYRLNGDLNPLHADPKIAAEAGFRQPILHGLATMGVATRALVKAVCGNNPDLMRSMFVRFSSPVYPGETIRTEIFNEGGGEVRFRCRVLERDVIVLDRGRLTLAA